MSDHKMQKSGKMLKLEDLRPRRPELDMLKGGPTAVEYAVMLSLIIVVC